MYKKKELEKIREQTAKELQDLVIQLHKEMFEVRMQHSLGKLKDVRTMKKKRRQIAQIKTILKEKEIMEGEK